MTTLLLLLALCSPARAAEPPGVLLAEARAHARQGDTDAMRAAAEAALAQPGEHQRQAQLLIAAAYELDDELEQALAIYDALVDAYPRHDTPSVLRLRQADTLGKLGRLREARRAVRPLRRDPDLTPDRRLQLTVLHGLWDLERGKDAKGLKAIDEALSMDAPSPWWRAKGHHALIRYAIDQADAFPVGRSPEEIQQALDVRAQLVALAQQQTVRLIRLDQPELSHDALMALADLHERTGLDVLLATGDVGDPRVEGLLLKALAYVERGLELTARTQTGHGAELLERRDALQARVEALSGT